MPDRHSVTFSPEWPTDAVFACDLSIGELPKLTAIAFASLDCRAHCVARHVGELHAFIRRALNAAPGRFRKASGGRKAAWHNRRRLAARSPR
jgi:hypothetical protein